MVPSLWEPSRVGCVRWSGSRREGHGREAPLYQLCRAACAPGRRAPERARLPSHHEGAGNQHQSRGARSVIQAPRHIKVYGPCLPLSSMRVALSFLLNECCGAVSREVELWLSDCELLIIVGSSAFPCSCRCPRPMIAFVFFAYVHDCVIASLYTCKL